VRKEIKEEYYGRKNGRKEDEARKEQRNKGRKADEEKKGRKEGRTGNSLDRNG
jgi:hypothetical protein